MDAMAKKCLIGLPIGLAVFIFVIKIALVIPYQLYLVLSALFILG